MISLRLFSLFIVVFNLCEANLKGSVIHGAVREMTIQSESILPQQYDALNSFYDSLNGEHWIWKDSTMYNFGIPWNFSDGSDPCLNDWQGIACSCSNSSAADYYCNIVEISLISSNLVGTIPNSIGNLTTLQVLNLNLNDISGNLPVAFAQLADLRSLLLYENELTGSIPLEILSQLKNLSFIDIGGNNFNGSLTNAIGNMTSLKQLYVSSNFLTGTLPPELATLTKLHKLDVQANEFNGTIPTALFSMDTLEFLYLYDNLLTGTIPPYVKTSKLGVIALYDNLLTGTLPISICSAVILKLFNVQNNFLTGTLPPCYGNTLSLEYLSIYDNLFTGTLPATLGNLIHLQAIDAGGNSFTGSIPDVFNNVTQLIQFLVNEALYTGTLPTSIIAATNLTYLYTAYNFFSGTVPNTYGAFQLLNDLQINNNLLSGTVPAVFSALPNITIFFVQNNGFTGNLDNVFDVAVQKELTSVDFSNNQLTGTLPVAVFSSQQMTSFAAVSNCFHGTIPREICNAAALQALALDGLSTASSCRREYFPSVAGVQAYSLPHRHVHGEIPSCLFNMTRLRTLHLSGNDLYGSLPGNLVIGSALQQLSLSHNALTGTIPDFIQKQSWLTLDLAFNRFTGLLSEEFSPIASNASVSLDVNRLSGIIPSSMRGALNITILNGNLFDCDTARTQLPRHDPVRDDYICGSQTTNRTFYAFACLTGVLACCLVIAWWIPRWYHTQNEEQRTLVPRMSAKVTEFVKNIHFWLSVYDDPATKNHYSNIPLLKQHFQQFRRNGVYLAGYTLLLLLPPYIAMSYYYSMYWRQYIWAASAAFCSGENAGYILFVLLFVTNLLLLHQFLTYSETTTKKSEPHTPPAVRPSAMSFSDKKQSYRLQQLWQAMLHSPNFWLAVIATINILILVPVNILYVYLILYYNIYIIRTSQILVALFKIWWNVSALSYLLRHANRYLHRSYDNNTNMSRLQTVQGCVIATSTGITFQCMLILINNVVIPCLTIAAISVNCYYNIVVPPLTVTSNYQYTYCNLHYYSVPADSFYCVVEDTLTSTTSYLPPFTYSYQCSSTILTNYTVVFMYVLLGLGYFLPLLKLAGAYVFHHATPGSIWHTLARYATPHNLRPIQRDLAASYVPNRYVMFDKKGFVVGMTTYFAILATYGVIFPLLSIVAATSILSTTYYEQAILGRLLRQAESAGVTHYFAIVNEECKHISASLRYVVWILMIFAAFFYAFFVFDSLGDNVNGMNVAITVLMAMAPGMYWVCMRVARYGKGQGVELKTVELLSVSPGLKTEGKEEHKLRRQDQTWQHTEQQQHAEQQHERTQEDSEAKEANEDEENK